MIQRWKAVHDLKHMVTEPDGEWVEYKAHIEEIERLKKAHDEFLTSIGFQPSEKR